MSERDLFLTAETHWAAKAAQGRVEAINKSPSLHWLVQVEGALLSFDTAPTFLEIAKAARRKGVEGDVRVISILVARKRPRPLILLPWMRKRGPEVLDFAAE